MRHQQQTFFGGLTLAYDADLPNIRKYTYPKSPSIAIKKPTRRLRYNHFVNLNLNQLQCTDVRVSQEKKTQSTDDGLIFFFGGMDEE